jgi:hypothetical protein
MTGTCSEIRTGIVVGLKEPLKVRAKYESGRLGALGFSKLKFS